MSTIYLLGAIFSLCSFQALSSTEIQTVQASGFTGYHAYMIFSRVTQWSVVNLKVNEEITTEKDAFIEGQQALKWKAEREGGRWSAKRVKIGKWQPRNHKGVIPPPLHLWTPTSRKCLQVMDNISNNFSCDERSCRNCQKKKKKFG